MTIHMQEAEAARDFSKVMAHVAAGDEVLLERNGSEIAIVKAVSRANQAARMPKTGRTIQEVIAALEYEERQSGPVFIDEGYAEDLASAHTFWNQALDTPAWE